jgi:DNA-binding transcriptional regulator YiaG
VLYNVKAKLLKQPTPEEIKEVRKKAGLTQQQAAELVHRAAGSRWREWEGGKYGIDLAVWELFLLKTGLRTLEKT